MRRAPCDVTAFRIAKVDQQIQSLCSAFGKKLSQMMLSNAEEKKGLRGGRRAVEANCSCEYALFNAALEERISKR